MLKRLMISAATTALVMGTALAQETPTAPATTAKSQVVLEQTADQFLASKFKGTDVIGNDNSKIGDVNDVLFDQKGNILAYIIGVGGFLGIGAKDVAA